MSTKGYHYYNPFYEHYKNLCSQEQDSRYLNPIRRISRNRTVFEEARKQQLMLNIRKINDKSYGDDRFYAIARRLFFGINSILNKNDTEFTTIQHAYSYAITGETADTPVIEDDMFLSMANICALQMSYTPERSSDKLSLRETRILADLRKKYDTTTLTALMIEIRTGEYFKEVMTTYNNGRTIYYDKSPIDDNGESWLCDDYNDAYNNMLLNNVLSNSKNADEMAKTLDFQRFIGAEPSLLLTLGTSLCRSVAFYNEYGRFGAEPLASTATTAVLENLSSRNSSLKTRVETIIRNNNVKPPNISLNSEICDYVKSLSNSDIVRINSCGLYLAYYNAIVFFILDKIRQFYNQPCDQNQINTIAAIIHYYLYNIDDIYENIRSIFHDKGDDYIDLLKMSKIVENMVENGDFCSYPREFCVEKAKMLYFS